MDHGDGAQGSPSQLVEALETWRVRESVFESLVSEADRLGRLGDGCSVELQSLVSALRTATVLARSCHLACAAILAGLN